MRWTSVLALWRLDLVARLQCEPETQLRTIIHRLHTSPLSAHKQVLVSLQAFVLCLGRRVFDARLLRLLFTVRCHGCWVGAPPCCDCD